MKCWATGSVFHFFHQRHFKKSPNIVWKLYPVLRIRDILVRIWIRESVSLTNGSYYFRQWPSSFFAISFEATFTSFSKIKSHEKVIKQQELRFILLFFLIIERSGSVPRTTGSQKHTDPADPDPQHWLYQNKNSFAKKIRCSFLGRRRGEWFSRPLSPWPEDRTSGTCLPRIG